MTIEEIELKTKVIVSVTNGSDIQARFMSKVMRNMGDSILVIPFRHKGKRVSFDGKQVKITLEVRDASGVLWTFKGCKVIPVKKDGLVYHKIISSMRNGIENKRGGRRFYVWETITVQVDGIAAPIYCHLRDVGIIGLSFAIDLKKGVEIKDGTRVICSMKDKDGIEMQIETITIRHDVLEKYMIYGCKIDEPVARYVAYVKHLERKNTIVDADF